MFSKILKVSSYIQKYLSITVLLIMIVVVGLQVFFRYLLNTPLSWTEELARLLQIWLTFLVIGFVVGQREHIEISYFAELFPWKIQVILRTFVDIAILLFSIFLISWGIKLAILQYPSKSTALELPLTYFSLPFCVSSFFMIIHSIHLVKKDIFDIKNCLSAGNNR